MPLIRVSPETAPSAVEDLTRDFAETVAGVGASPALEKIAKEAGNLHEVLAARRIEVEVRVVDRADEEWVATAAAFLGLAPETLRRAAEGEVVVPETTPGRFEIVRVRSGSAPLGRRAGDRLPPVQVIVRGAVEPPAEEILKELLSEVRERPLTLIVSPPACDWTRALAALGSQDAWVCRAVSLEAGQAEVTLATLLGEPAWSSALELGGAWSGAKALLSLYEAFAVALESETRSLGAKRAVVEQQASKQTAASNPTEVLGQVRGFLQKRFDGFQKKLGANLDRLIDPHDGTVAVEVEGVIEALDELSVEKRPKIDVMTVPEPVQQQLLGRTTEDLTALVRSEIARLDALLEEVETSVVETIETKGGPPTTVNLTRLPRTALANQLERSMVLQRGYRGEIARRGPMDFFMAARRYQMIFFMVASAFGLSFIRSYREFTIPVGVLLLSYGLLSVINSARRQRAETEEKELTKAKDNLRSDMQRAMNDVRRAWEQTISGHLSEQQSAVLEAIDQSMKAFAAEANRQAAQQRELVQQQLKMLETSKRKVADGTKKAELSRQDLDPLIKQLLAFYAAATADLPISAGGASEDVRLPTAAVEALEKQSAAGAGAAEKLEKLRQAGGFTEAFQSVRDQRLAKPSGRPEAPARSPAAVRPRPGAPTPRRLPSPSAEVPPSAADEIAQQAKRKAEELQAQAAARLAELQGAQSSPVAEAPPVGSTPTAKKEPKKPGRLDQLKGGGGLTEAFASLRKRKDDKGRRGT